MYIYIPGQARLGPTTKMWEKCAHIPVVTCGEKYLVFGDKSQLGFPIISPASLSPAAMTLLHLVKYSHLPASHEHVLD